MLPEASADIIDFVVRPWGDSDYNPFIFRTMAIEKYKETYLSNFRKFVDATFGSKSVQLPTNRYAALMQFVLPWVARDEMWRLSKGVTVDQFVLDVEFAIANLNWKVYKPMNLKP